MKIQPATVTPRNALTDLENLKNVKMEGQRCLSLRVRTTSVKRTKHFNAETLQSIAKKLGGEKTEINTAP